MKISPLAAALLGGASVLVSTAPVQAAEAFSFHYDHVLGTSLDVVAVAAGEHVAAFAADIVRAEIDRLDALLSGWRNDSELMGLNAVASLNVSRDLFNVISACERWRSETLGAFSARLGGLERAMASGLSDLAVLAQGLNSARVSLDPANQRIEKPQTLSFAVDGLAKGYVIDRALEAARLLPGVSGLLVDIGGDIRVWGQAPTGKAWHVGVVAASNLADNAPPKTVLALTDQAVATSGRGLRDHIIFNPLSGKAVDNIVMATAVAPIAADADALASAFSVMTPEESLKMADKLTGVAAHIVDADGKTHVSRNWDSLVVAQNAPPKATAPSKAAAGTWPAGFTVKIDYEFLASTTGRRARNPYVTAWITNPAGELVRTLTFQADKARYMRENYVFWDKFSNAVDMYAVTKPTRPPGRYTLEWDGKDDKGRAMPQGSYTVNIEASREHGPHSIQRVDLNLGSAPVSGEAAASSEMGIVKAAYGKAP